MKDSWEGIYFDGRTARRWRVSVRLLATGLRMATQDETFIWWPYDEIRQVQGSYRGEPVRLERGDPFPESLLVEDPEFVQAIRQSAPPLRARLRSPLRSRRIILFIVLAGLAAAIVVASLNFWLIPALADILTPLVPVEWEARVGAAAFEQLIGNRRCTNPQLNEAIEQITDRLSAAAPRHPYTFHIAVANRPELNALAAPGGYIIIFRGLLTKTRRPEELAGVLAHEMQHVLQRHVTKDLLRQASLRVLITIPTGGAGTGALGEVAATVATLRHSREAEASADREGMRLIQAARIDPQGMIDIFLTLQAESGKVPGMLAYLSTHPGIEDRIRTLKELVAAPRAAPVPLLPGLPWEEVAADCAP